MNNFDHLFDGLGRQSSRGHTDSLAQLRQENAQLREERDFARNVANKLAHLLKRWLLQDPGFDHWRETIEQTRNPWESPPPPVEPRPEKAEAPLEPPPQKLTAQDIPPKVEVPPSPTLLTFIEDEMEMGNDSDDDFFSKF